MRRRATPCQQVDVIADDPPNHLHTVTVGGHAGEVDRGAQHVAEDSSEIRSWNDDPPDHIVSARSRGRRPKRPASAWA